MSNNTSEEIHGHAVLEMMNNSGISYSRESLIAAIDEKFGSDARFVVCCGGGMTSTVLVDTLIERGKFKGERDAFVFNQESKCEHD